MSQYLSQYNCCHTPFLYTFLTGNYMIQYSQVLGTAIVIYNMLYFFFCITVGGIAMALKPPPNRLY